MKKNVNNSQQEKCQKSAALLCFFFFCIENTLTMYKHNTNELVICIKIDLIKIIKFIN